MFFARYSQRDCASRAPIVYRLGHQILNLGSRVRFPVGAPVFAPTLLVGVFLLFMSTTNDASAGVGAVSLLHQIDLGDPIGRGDMGAVYVARVRSRPDAKPSAGLERVAVRVLSSRFHHDRAFLSRFYADATAACRLRHPNIVQFLDVAEVGNRHLLAMEWVEGMSLDRWLQQTGKMPEPKLLVIASAVANALKIAWEQRRLLHRALRPQNLFVDNSGGLVRVADLGLARAVMNDADNILPNVPVSNPHYTAPELTTGDLAKDCRGDIYALGLTLYHLATGVMPFSDYRDRETLEKQRHGRLPSARQLNPALSSGLCGVIEKMLARQPRDRYADYSALLTDLRALTSGSRPTAVIESGASVMSSGRAQQGAEAPRVHKRDGHHGTHKVPKVVVRKAVPPPTSVAETQVRRIHHYPSWMTTRMVLAAWILTFILTLACFALLVRNCSQGRQWFWQSQHRIEFMPAVESKNGLVCVETGVDSFLAF